MTKHGFTLIEVMIAATVFLIVTGIALSFSVAAVSQTDDNTATAWSLSGLVAVLEPLEQELAQASLSYVDGEEETTGTVIDTANACHQISVADGTSQNAIRFRKMVGYNKTDQRIIWSKPITYQLALNKGENPVTNPKALPGKDDNDNGYVDEMCLQKVYDIDTSFITTSLLFRNAASIVFERKARLLTITMIYYEKPGVDRTITTSVALSEL